MRKLLIFMVLFGLFFRVNAQENKNLKEQFEYLENRKSLHMSYSALGMHSREGGLLGLANLGYFNHTWNRILNNFDFMIQKKIHKWIDLGITINKYTGFEGDNTEDYIHRIESTDLPDSNIPINVLGIKSRQRPLAISGDTYIYLPFKNKKHSKTYTFFKLCGGVSNTYMDNYILENGNIVYNYISSQEELFWGISFGTIIQQKKISTRSDIQFINFMNPSSNLRLIDYNQVTNQIEWRNADMTKFAILISFYVNI